MPQTTPETIDLTPSPDLFNRALAWADVTNAPRIFEGHDGKLQADVSGVYPMRETINSLISAIVSIYIIQTAGRGGPKGALVGLRPPV